LFVSRFHQSTVLAPEKYSGALTGEKMEEIANSSDPGIELIPKLSPSKEKKTFQNDQDFLKASVMQPFNLLSPVLWYNLHLAAATT
jgi:hypothetical protein